MSKAKQKPFLIEELTPKQTIRALHAQGQHLTTMHNDNYGQSICERAIEHIEDLLGERKLRCGIAKIKNKIEKEWIKSIARIKELQTENNKKITLHKTSLKYCKSCKMIYLKSSPCPGCSVKKLEDLRKLLLRIKESFEPMPVALMRKREKKNQKLYDDICKTLKGEKGSE
jgi:hypothetical protein